MRLPDGFLSYCNEWEERIGAFIEFAPDGPKTDEGDGGAGSAASTSESAAAVAGFPFAVKDNIAVKGFSLTCGSKLLANFRSPYTATAVGKLQTAGASVIGKTNLDEFGMGSSTDNSALKKTNNPWDTSRVPGGSSGGSAAAVAAGIVPFALGTDTGGSIREPAAFCGVVGLKPTYGAVSRFGLVAYASSLECAGVIADTVSRCRAVFSIIRGRDPMDETTQDPPPNAPPLYGSKPGSKCVIGVLSPEAIARAAASTVESERLDAAVQAAVLEDEVRRAFDASRERLAGLGYKLVDVEVPALKYGVPAYYTIATAEASANLARFDSVRYGVRPGFAENADDLVDRARDAGFGPEVKLRILLGTFVLRSGFQDRYYLRAQRIRAGIKKSFESLLGGDGYGDGAGTECNAKCGAVLLPVFPTRAFGRGPSALSAFAQKAADLYTCCANLAGLPALSFPVSVEGGLPVGVQLLGGAFAEGTLLDIAEEYESRYPFPHPPGYRAFWS
ncbi:MAG: aspartyl/glutamyl-tRNA amidotransferase subunit A [Treponema sp.]|jgi:aspartyl-tRNA(Asn)/glutamyl-tRNA(Gln) amidotransferase subunit A|nr:aspartyl/glutamyl-tRNA amidotransferase subunit A [Treponema sp.]